MARMLRRPWIWIALLAVVSLTTGLLFWQTPHGKSLQTGYALLHDGMSPAEVQDCLGAENQPLLVEKDRMPGEGLAIQTIVTWDDGRNQVRIIFGSDDKAKTLGIGQSGKPPMVRQMLDAIGW
jgi:hypothetical protein